MLIVYAFVVVVNIVDEVLTKMPIGIVTNSISERIPLASAPPDGFVIVRRMTYGEKLLRSNMAAKFLMGGAGPGKDFQGEMEMNTAEVAYWDFANLVVEHNLTDEKEVLLNFKNRVHVKMLSGPIGEEIGKIIDDFQEPEKTEEVKNS